MDGISDTKIYLEETHEGKSMMRGMEMETNNGEGARENDKNKHSLV